jgi:hypothetical protein
MVERSCEWQIEKDVVIITAILRQSSIISQNEPQEITNTPVRTESILAKIQNCDFV